MVAGTFTLNPNGAFAMLFIPVLVFVREYCAYRGLLILPMVFCWKFWLEGPAKAE